MRWGVAENIALAWAITLPATALGGALVYAVTAVFGSGVAGPLAVTVAGVVLLASVLGRRLAQGRALSVEG